MQSTKTLTPISEKRSNEAFLKDLDKPDLQNLAYCLRHPETWPKGFVWDYAECAQCAMGLARVLWREMPELSNDRNVGTSRMAQSFAIPYEAAASIFFGQGSWAPVDIETTGSLWWKQRTFSIAFERVTPEMVADEIDRYVAGAE